MKYLLSVPAILLAGCTGLYLDLPDDAEPSDVDITITPITPALVAAQAVAPSPVALPRADTGSAPYQYRIGPGDILDITIPSIAAVPGTLAAGGNAAAQDRDRGYTVAADGSIYVPFVGAVQVRGLSVREVQGEVIKGLSRFIKVPEVTVSVAAFRSQKVLVAGQVPKPAYLPVTDVPLTLVGALTAAGSTPVLRGDLVPRPLGSSGGSSGVATAESGDYSKVRITRGKDVQHVDVHALLRAGDLRGDPLLRDGDVVYVPPVERSYVFALGEFAQANILEIVENRTSLAEVMMVAGGLNQQSAKAGRVYVIRGQLEKPQVFQLDANAPDALLLADAFTLQPRDVVYAAEANISRWNRFLSQLIPTVQSLLLGTVVATEVQ